MCGVFVFSFFILILKYSIDLNIQKTQVSRSHQANTGVTGNMPPPKKKIGPPGPYFLGNMAWGILNGGHISWDTGFRFHSLTITSLHNKLSTGLIQVVSSLLQACYLAAIKSISQCVYITCSSLKIRNSQVYCKFYCYFQAFLRNMCEQ